MLVGEATALFIGLRQVLTALLQRRHPLGEGRGIIARELRELVDAGDGRRRVAGLRLRQHRIEPLGIGAALLAEHALLLRHLLHLLRERALALAFPAGDHRLQGARQLAEALLLLGGPAHRRRDLLAAFRALACRCRLLRLRTRCERFARFV